MLDTALAGESALPTKVAEVVVVVDDVDLLAVQLGDDVAHPLAHRTDAGALGVRPATEVRTAILVRCPASRATATISTLPSAISGTSSANSFLHQVRMRAADRHLQPAHPPRDADTT